MTRSLKKVARTFDTVRFLFHLYLCPLVVTENEKKIISININHAENAYNASNHSTSRWSHY